MNLIMFSLKKNNKYLYMKYLLFFVIVYFPVFYNLNNLYIMIWDEARVACSSYEMLKNGNYFAVTYFDNLDDWSTKPVLLNWIQALFIKFFSFSELSVRLPSAIAGLVLCYSLLNFFKKQLNTFSLGFIITLVLITSTGYINIDHSVRTADYESVLSMFMIIGCLHFYIYVHDSKDKNILWAMLLFTGSTLIKGPAGLFFAPSLLVYLIIQKQFIRTLKNKYFYFGLLSFIVLVGGIYLLRERTHPGYLKLFNEMEFLGRQNKSIEGHEGEFWFYLSAFIELRFKTWYLLVPIGLIIGLFIAKEKVIRDVSLYFLILFIGFFLIISTAQTKCSWYDFSLFPIISYFAAIPIWFVYRFIITNTVLFDKSLYSKNFAFAFLLILFFFPYLKAYNNAANPEFDSGLRGFGISQHYLKYNRPIIKNSLIVVDGYCSPQLFYKYKNTDSNLSISNYKREYRVGEKIIAYEYQVVDFLEKNYQLELLDSFEAVKVYKVLGKK